MTTSSSLLSCAQSAENVLVVLLITGNRGNIRIVETLGKGPGSRGGVQPSSLHQACSALGPKLGRLDLNSCDLRSHAAAGIAPAERLREGLGGNSTRWIMMLGKAMQI